MTRNRIKDGDGIRRKAYRVILAREMRRPLDPETEHVHHKDFNPRNNERDNLAIVTPEEHRLIHALHNDIAEAKMGPPVIVCEECGREFELGRMNKKRDRFARSKARFCSKECRNKHRLKQRAIGGPIPTTNTWKRPFSKERLGQSDSQVLRS